jgi:hypothetical protein
VSEANAGQLISIRALSQRLGIPAFHIQRAIVQDIFPYIQDPMNKYRYVPATDTRTLNLLDRAAEIFKDEDLNVKFADAIRLAKREYETEEKAG